MNSVSINSPIGYKLEVDLEYPNELHELHNDYPLATEKLKITQNMLSHYCGNTGNKYDIKISGVNILVPNLSNKSKYVLYYRNLQLYSSLPQYIYYWPRFLSFHGSSCFTYAQCQSNLLLEEIRAKNSSSKFWRKEFDNLHSSLQQ